MPQAHWCAAELLRVAALARLKEGETPVAQRLLEEALAIATRQGALAWELRAATTLAELLLSEGQGQKARDLLAPVVARVTEGFDTGDSARRRRLWRASMRLEMSLSCHPASGRSVGKLHEVEHGQ